MFVFLFIPHTVLKAHLQVFPTETVAQIRAFYAKAGLEFDVEFVRSYDHNGRELADVVRVTSNEDIGGPVWAAVRKVTRSELAEAWWSNDPEPKDARVWVETCPADRICAALEAAFAEAEAKAKELGL